MGALEKKVCKRRESKGEGSCSSLVSGLGVFFCFFLSRPVEPGCLLSVDKIWGLEELTKSFLSTTTA